MYLFYIPNILLLLSGLLSFRLKSNDSKFSLSLVQIMLCLSLLSTEYFLIDKDSRQQMIPIILLSENILALLWCTIAYRLYDTAQTDILSSRIFPILGIAAGIAVMCISVCSFSREALSMEKTV
ncbi:MAG: hypothetical protein HC887_02920 [Desulfobacteraceae bacterium]|nr:hypothetical protein [Desulfobacteraceae bacterium]